MTPADRENLRCRLLALRRDALEQRAAADHLDTGLMRLVADAAAAGGPIERWLAV